MNVQIYLLLLVSCSLYGLARGGAPERIGVALLLSAVVASSLTPLMTSTRFQGIEIGLLIVDSLLFVAVTVLALRANRYWTMWWAAVKLNTIITHLLMLTPAVMPWPYAVGNALWSYPSPLLIAIGALRHRRRLRRTGADPAWSPVSGEPNEHGPN